MRDGQNMSHEKIKPSKLKPSKPVASKPPVKAVEPITSLEQTSIHHAKTVPEAVLDDDNMASISMDKTSDLIAPEKLANLISTEAQSASKRPEKEHKEHKKEATKKETKPSISEKLAEREAQLEPIQVQAEKTEKIVRTEPSKPKQAEVFAPVEDGIGDHEIKKSLLVNLQDLSRSQLSWFDNRVDYMAYVSLREAQELYAIPRLSNRYRFQIIGCTMDGLFQVAEPIPGVLYQAFAIGLQAISRNGLASTRELELFGHQVKSFADKMGGEILLTDVESFLNVAQPLDEICERVDQTIAIHLVSRISILGIELRSTLEELGFQLMQDGTFGFSEVGGDVKYSAVSLDGSQFTSSLLASQPYKGFSMLFDITRVPQGESNFDEFMNLAVKLSSKLNLELVDDQIQELSTEWLREVRSYVLDRQNEMLKVGIEPAGELAQRLFA